MCAAFVLFHLLPLCSDLAIRPCQKIPLKNAESGEVEHFVAGQIDISAALESVHSLSILIGAGYPNDEDDEDDGEKDESSQKDNIIRFSSPVSLKVNLEATCVEHGEVADPPRHIHQLGSKSMFGPDRRQSVGFVMSETIAEEGITSPGKLSRSPCGAMFS